MPKRHRRAAALATGGAATQARHLRVRTRLVNEDQLGWIKLDLRIKPGLPRRGDVRPVLLGGVRCFF